MLASLRGFGDVALTFKITFGKNKNQVICVLRYVLLFISTIYYFIMLNLYNGIIGWTFYGQLWKVLKQKETIHLVFGKHSGNMSHHMEIIYK